MKIPEDRQSTEIELVLSYRWLLEGLFLPAIGCVGIIGRYIKGMKTAKQVHEHF